MKAMKSLVMVFAFVVSWAHCLAQVGGGRIIHPPDPVEEAKNARVIELIDRAKELIRSIDDQGAITKLQEAAVVEATMANFHARAKYALARMYVKQNRIPEALDAYRATFTWNPSANYGNIQRGDLDPGSHAGIEAVIEYAVLLAKEGRAEDAKAMYYYGLRAYFAPMPRSQEPAPFLVVFDPEPEGIQWQYTPPRLEAAALMVLTMLSSGTIDFATNELTRSRQWLGQVRTLAPDWFYPVLYLANNATNGSAQEQQLLAEADALARPGLERQLVEGFRQRLAEWREYCEQNELAWSMATDNRTMTEGAERRRRMQCLRPNEQILRRLSIERPQ